MSYKIQTLYLILSLLSVSEVLSAQTADKDTVAWDEQNLDEVQVRSRRLSVSRLKGAQNGFELNQDEGIKKIETNVERQEVITYDAEKTTPEKLEKALSEIGYKVKVVKAPATVQKKN